MWCDGLARSASFDSSFPLSSESAERLSELTIATEKLLALEQSQAEIAAQHAAMETVVEQLHQQLHTKDMELKELERKVRIMLLNGPSFPWITRAKPVSY